MYSQKAMDDAMEKANSIQENTQGIKVTNDPFAGKTYAPTEFGPEEFKKVTDKQFKPKRY